MYKPSAVATYHDLMQLVYAVSGDGDGPLSRDSANQVTSAFRALACKNPAAAEVWGSGIHYRPPNVGGVGISAHPFLYSSSPMT